MAGCGYVCPVCEGKGFTEEGETCNYCTIESVKDKPLMPDDQEWIKTVHEGPCCAGDES